MLLNILNITNNMFHEQNKCLKKLAKLSFCVCAVHCFQLLVDKQSIQLKYPESFDLLFNTIIAG